MLERSAAQVVYTRNKMLGVTSIIVMLLMLVFAAGADASSTTTAAQSKVSTASVVVTASAPPSDFCKKPGFNPSDPNHGWPVGQGETIWNACAGKLGAWMFQLPGTDDPIGHQHGKTYHQLVVWRANHGNPSGTFWFDAYVVHSGACHSGSSVYIHLPTRVYPSAPCGAKTIYQLNIRGHTVTGTWSHVEYIRRCTYHGYEGTIWVIKIVHTHGCGCG